MTVAARRHALVLDEMFAPAIADELRQRGHDVIAVAADATLRSMADQELLAWAVEHKRRIVTENVKDFRPLMARTPDHATYGVLFTSPRSFPRSRRAPGALIDALDTWLATHAQLGVPVEAWLPRGSLHRGLVKGT